MSYEAFAYYYDSLMDQDFYNDYIQFINEHVKDYQTVLELGCGTGEIAIRLAHLGKQVCATDISKDMLEVAKYKCIDFKADVMLSRIDMCDFAVDSQLDLILCLCDSLNYVIDLKNVKGDVCYDNVSFHYSDDNKTVLSQVSIHIPAGKSVALVGPSGGGKTTICSLLPRFYDVTAGKVTIDGKDVRDLTLKSLRNQIGMVQQDVYLFDGTIRENIAYGKPDATDEEIKEAARRANMDDFIMQLPKQYDTYVGEKGTRLSGGQKQRISIARVFLKNPPILILDEATSALDNESERYIQKSLEELAKNRTTITIAHRLSTIKRSDEIIVITEDGIAERGTHETLLAKNGIYARYYNL